jgi:hypothetical protein
MYHDADTDCAGGKAAKRAVSLLGFDHPIPMEWEEDEVHKWNPMEHSVYLEPIPVERECG